MKRFANMADGVRRHGIKQSASALLIIVDSSVKRVRIPSSFSPMFYVAADKLSFKLVTNLLLA